MHSGEPQLVETPEETPAPSLYAVTARLAGLEAALAAPEKIARRYARLRARRGQAPGVARVSPMRPGYAPGRRSVHTPDWLVDMLAHLTIPARDAAIWRPPDRGDHAARASENLQ